MYIAFVCTANLCRSPFAEFYAREEALKLGRSDLTFVSFGLQVLPGLRAPVEAKEAALQFDVSLDSHMSKQTPGIPFSALDRAYVMEPWQREELQNLYPDEASRVLLLAELLPGLINDEIIPDPYRKGAFAYLASYSLIAKAVAVLLKSLQ